MAVDAQEKLAGHVHHFAVAVLVLGGQHGHGVDAEGMAHAGQLKELGQVQGAPVIQGLRPAVQGRPADGAGLGIVGLIICAPFPLSGQQGLPFPGLVLLLEARGPA